MCLLYVFNRILGVAAFIGAAAMVAFAVYEVIR